jgi:uncharacterized protein YecA (UPF0149 family)
MEFYEEKEEADTNRTVKNAIVRGWCQVVKSAVKSVQASYLF